jgi:hypothetical protein
MAHLPQCIGVNGPSTLLARRVGKGRTPHSGRPGSSDGAGPPGRARPIGRLAASRAVAAARAGLAPAGHVRALVLRLGRRRWGRRDRLGLDSGRAGRPRRRRTRARVAGRRAAGGCVGSGRARGGQAEGQAAAKDGGPDGRAHQWSEDPHAVLPCVLFASAARKGRGADRGGPPRSVRQPDLDGVWGPPITRR